MKNTNIGIVNLIISNRLKESYFNDALLEESKKLAFNFFDIIKNSPILQLEFKVFNNMENKHIENDLAATRYIDNNIKLFEVYTIDEIIEERKRVASIISENNISLDENKVKLYNAIDDLIMESLTNYDEIDVDSIHESFEVVLNHIKQPKRGVMLEDININDINEDVIEIAVDKFNEKYDMLNEDDKNLLKILIKSSNEEKKSLLESYKSETISILENINKENTKDKVAIAIQKIKEMAYKIDNVEDNIINLHELKRELL